MRQALSDIEFSGWMTAELGRQGGSRENLADVSERMDKIIAG